MSLKLNPPFFLCNKGMISTEIGGTLLSLGYHSEHAFGPALNYDHRFFWRVIHLTGVYFGGGPSPRKVDGLIVGWMMFCKVLGCYALSAQAELDGQGKQEFSHVLPEQCREWAVVNHHHFAALMVQLEQESHSLIIEGYRALERN